MAARNEAQKKGTKKKGAKKISTETGRWNGNKFTVSSKLIRGFDGLQIKGSNETEDKKKNGQLYSARKNGRPAEVSVTAHLNAFTGCNVRKEALAFVEQAQKGDKDYFYIGTKKLLPYKLMLTEATVKEVQIAPGHAWVSAQVQLTFRQTGTGGKSVNSGGSGNGSGGSGSLSGSSKVSVKTSSPKTSSTVLTGAKVGAKVGAAVGGAVLGKTGAAIGTAVGAAAGSVAGAVKNALTGLASSSGMASSVKSADTAISRIVSSAKSYSSAKKTRIGGGSITNYAATK